MDAVFFLLPISLLLVGLFVVLFHWSVRSGQFDDLKTPALRMLFDDDEHLSGKETNNSEESTPNPSETTGERQ